MIISQSVTGTSMSEDTHIVESCSVLRRLNNLNGDVLSYLQAGICWKRYLRQTNGTIVELVVWSDDLKRRNDIVTHVGRCQITWPLNTDVDVDEGHRMTREPSRLYSHYAVSIIQYRIRALDALTCSTCDRPLCSVSHG